MLEGAKGRLHSLTQSCPSLTGGTHRTGTVHFLPEHRALSEGRELLSELSLQGPPANPIKTKGCSEERGRH